MYMKNVETLDSTTGDHYTAASITTKRNLKVDLGKCVQIYRAPFLHLPGDPNSLNQPLLNITPDITRDTIGTIWETIKAYIGQIISYTSCEKNKQRRSMADLTARISQLENQFINNPSSIILKEYLLLKADFNTLSIVATEEMLIKSRHAYYENGEKANRLLAHQLRQSFASHIIPAIKTHNTLLSGHQEIYNSF